MQVMRAIREARDFNWVYLDYPRKQFRKRGWMEFRKDLDEHVPFSIAGAVELLRYAQRRDEHVLALLPSNTHQHCDA